MSYSISRISKILGLSSEALRFYEKKGVIDVLKDSSNGYRSYDPLDIGTLLRCRGYNQFGLSLTDAAKLIHECELEEVYHCLLGQESFLEKEIERQQRVLRVLRQSCKMIGELPQSLGQCVLENAPGLYRINYHRNYVLIDTPDVLKRLPQWSAMAPLSFVSLLFPQHFLGEGIQDYYVGLGVLEEDAPFLNIKEGGFIQHIPSRPSVSTVICAEKREILTPDSFSHLSPFLRENNLMLNGDGFSQMISAILRDTEYTKRYYKVWFPVKNLSNPLTPKVLESL